ncbi:hypothetical protein ACLB2K_049431 [Fragaria x ananassa]
MPQLVMEGGFKFFDDDGRPKRTGNVMTASAHIITAVIGSGVLSLSWAIAQLGWVVGPIVIVMFSIVTYSLPSCLLVACYRDPVTGKKNSTYSAAVRNHLGGFMYKVLGVVQRVNLYGSTIGYTITACISMVAIRRNACVHKHGEGKPCLINSNPYMITFGVIEIMLSQIPYFDKLSWLSTVAAIMSFTYSGIGLAIGIAKVAETGTIQGCLTGVTIGVQVTRAEKIWRIFRHLDTVKSPPSEAKTMKTASKISLSVTSIFYILCGCFGYAAFGDLAPGNILTGAGFFNPSRLIDIANAAIVIHLIGAYQVFSQPFYAFVEKKAAQLFPDNHFITKDIKIMSYKLNLFRVVWRTLYVISTTLLSMIFPFFNGVVGFLGALGYWPKSIYFPVAMCIAQKKIPKWSTRWIFLQVLCLSALVIALLAAVGSIVGVVESLKDYKPFMTST